MGPPTQPTGGFLSQLDVLRRRGRASSDQWGGAGRRPHLWRAGPLLPTPRHAFHVSRGSRHCHHYGAVARYVTLGLMSFRSIVRDVKDGFGSFRDGFGSLSRRSFDVRLSGLIGHRRGKSQCSVQELHDPCPVVQQSRWASLPPELLRDVIKRLEASESTWPSRKNVVACAAVCRTWREMCKEIVRSPESNFLGTNFVIYDTQPPYNGAALCPPGRTSHRFSKKVSPKVPSGSYSIAQVTYELNVLGTRGPRRMHCVMYSIPASSLEPGRTVPGQPENLIPRSLEDSFRSMSFSKSSIMDRSMDFNSSRFSDITGGIQEGEEENEIKERPLVLRNKPPRWHEQLQCWCLNFRGRVTVASVKNFQLVSAVQPAAGAPTPSEPPAPSEHDKIILQFGKVAKDMFTMDYRYPLSAFQAFAICLSSFDTKLACE
ncbi:hypothetical protein B296_00029711 [Ensete ventricosum]|uniref:Tubby-like F-box protein n=1 Tax=Ensete ventricosum TaxID=4639 RepID=A0A426XY79_ENSVE|nr:hypothetical protein B296_00029711 [Ensete ventricosum]